MNPRDQLMHARAEFARTRRDYEYPNLLFLSLEFDQQLCQFFKQQLKEMDRVARGVPTMDGELICGMTAHVVPTLESGFHVARSPSPSSGS